MLANKTYLIVLMTILCLYQMTMVVKSFPVPSIETQEGMNLFERSGFDGQKDLEEMFYKRAGGANRAAAAAQMQKAGTWAKSQVNVISKTQFGQSVRNGAKNIAANPHVQKVVETVKPYVKQGMTHAKTGASYVSGKASSLMSKFTPAAATAANPEVTYESQANETNVYFVKRGEERLFQGIFDMPKAKEEHNKSLNSFYSNYAKAKARNDKIGRFKAASQIYWSSGPIGSRVHTFGKALRKTASEGVSFDFTSAPP